MSYVRKLARKIRSFLSCPFKNQNILLDYYKKQDQNILFTSYTCSGGTWLENCFIELGIRLDDIPNVLFKYKRPYTETHSEYELLPTAEPSKVGLPSLTFKKNFYFRNNVFCHFSHTIPTDQMAKKFKTIVLVRDPRDALWSEYNAHPYQCPNFEEFAKSRINIWKEFHQTCLKMPNMGFFRFEDYKLDPVRHLKNILEFSELKYCIEDIQKAVLNSTSEKSREAEQIYISKTPEDKRFFKHIHNRSGKVDQYKSLSEHHATFIKIQKEAEDVMRTFNYF